jgi:hypothetical protein
MVIPFTTQIRELIAVTLPQIGTLHTKDGLRQKYIIPNQHRWVRFRGYWLRFVPAYGPAGRGAPDHFIRVLAILVQSPVTGRSDYLMPTCRLTDPDTGQWPAPMNAWIDKLDRCDQDQPGSPLDEDGVPIPENKMSILAH